MNSLSMGFLIINFLSSFSILLMILFLSILIFLLFQSNAAGDSPLLFSGTRCPETKSKGLWICGLVLIVIITLIPSDKTMYLIFASEIGEEILINEESSALYQDLRSVVRSYAKDDDSLIE